MSLSYAVMERWNADLPGVDIRRGDERTRLFMGFFDFGACSGHFALGHVPGETTDVILQKFVFAF